MDAYLVSMPAAVEKFNNSKAILDKLGFNVIHQVGIKGTDVDKGIISGSSELTNGEKGCFASHVTAWRRFLSSDKEYAAFFEDDISTYADSDTLNTKIEQAKDIGFDILYLGRCLDCCMLQKDLGHGIYKVSKPACTHAYVLNRSTAKKFLDGLPGSISVDLYIREFNINKLAVVPSIFTQDVWKYQSSLRDRQKSFLNTFECADFEVPNQRIAWIVVMVILIIFILFLVYILVKDVQFRFR